MEFGLINTPQGRRCFGAGIVSSPSEARAAMEGKACEFRPFDLMTALRTPYRIDIVQPIYYVIDSFAQLEVDHRGRYRCRDQRGQGSRRLPAGIRSQGVLTDTEFVSLRGLPSSAVIVQRPANM
ncbi:hypothetical protein [Rhizobium yanglingense]